MSERLDKQIAAGGAYTRSQARALIKAGRVAVDGVTVKDIGYKAENAALTLDGVPFLHERHCYLMLNKPAGVVSASRSEAEPTVVDLVPQSLKRDGLFPAGRLDKDTTGFVLITNDGEFAHDILSPKKHVDKTYLATLERPLTKEDQAAFAKGILLGDGTQCLKAEASFVEGEPLMAKVILHEGRYHQVKRMFASLGNHVTALKRVQIGGLKLDEGLKPGECRALTREELERIKK